ncbi:MAG: hypothetical protein U0136_12120 [Bdellovibrionota bacterium]
MIDEAVIQLAGIYVGYWSVALKGHARYALDSSWPSIGTVQLTLAHLRGKADLSDGDKTLVAGAAAYIGSLAHQNWSSFDENVKVDLKLITEPEREITLTATRGPKLKAGEAVSIPVYSSLLNWLRAPSSPLPVYGRYIQTFAPEEFGLATFFLGLFTGLSPLGAGPWKDLPDTEAKIQIYSADVALSKSCAGFSLNVFPTDTTGADPRIYSGGTILPPAGYGEKFFGARATYSLHQRLVQTETSPEEMQATALNLATNPNLCLAVPGYALSVALAADPLSRRLLAVSDGFGPIKLALKGAIAIARTAHGHPESVFSLLKENKIEEAEALLSKEQLLGLQPIFRIPVREAHAIPTLASHLYWTLAAEARKLIDAAAAKQLVSPAITVQGIALDCARGDFARAARELESFTETKIWSEEDSDSLASLYFELRAMVALAAREFAQAQTYFERAIELGSANDLSQAQLIALHAECLKVLGEREMAIEGFKQAVELYPLVQAQINLFRLEHSLRPKDDHTDTLARLVSTAPRNTDIFALVRAFGDANA